jgi:hypothetical protein
MSRNPGKGITEYHIASLFSDPYLEAATVGIAVSRFRSTGIYPIDRTVFTDVDYSATIMTECNEPQTVPANSEQVLKYYSTFPY